jgi:hypothetical protein
MNRSLAFISIGTIAFLALLFGAYLAFGRFSPDAEWRRMLSAMGKQTTVSFATAVGWTRFGASPEIAGVEAQGAMRLTSGVPEDDVKFHAVSYGKTTPLADVSGEARELAGKRYLREDPSTAWQSFDAVAWQGSGPILPGISFPPLSPDFSFPDWSAASAGRVRDLLSRADIFHFSYDGAVEKGTSETERVIGARFDASATDGFLLDLVRARTGQEPDDHDRAVAQGLANALSRLSVKLWIGERTHLLYRLHATGLVDDAGMAEPFDARLDLSGFGDPVVIDVPPGAVPFHPVDAGVLPVAASVAPAVTASASAQSGVRQASADDPDGDGLSNLLEAFYGTDPHNPDTDGDGVSDGKEVLLGRNPRGSGSLFGFGL